MSIETILYCGTMALNGILAMGVKEIGRLIILSMQFLLFMIYHTGWPCDFIPELDEACVEM